MSRILLTGVTGYVGGQVLYFLSRANLADVTIVCLVRDNSKAKVVRAAYPDVEIIDATLDDADILEREAKVSDVVLHLAATKHAASAEAIAKGLQARQTPGYWIQISGATVYAPEEIAEGRFGYASAAVYDDVKDQEQILSIIRKQANRVVENIILSQPAAKVKTALIVGPHIYGVGQGPCNQRTVQGTEIAKATLELGHGFILNEGANIWSTIHVRDISSLIVRLVEAALGKTDGLWNDDGVFNVDNGEQLTFKELGALIAKEAEMQGLINPNAETETIDAAKADSLSGHASILWGTNARTTSSKAKEMLGWKPSGPSIVDEIPELVRLEAGALKNPK